MQGHHSGAQLVGAERPQVQTGDDDAECFLNVCMLHVPPAELGDDLGVAACPDAEQVGCIDVIVIEAGKPSGVVPNPQGNCRQGGGRRAPLLCEVLPLVGGELTEVEEQLEGRGQDDLLTDPTHHLERVLP